MLLLLSLVTGLFSLVLPSSTNGDPHRSGFKFQTAALSILCVMFHVQLCFVKACFPVMAPKYFFAPFVTIPEAPNYDRYNHTFLAPHSCFYVHKLLNLIYFLLLFTRHLSAGTATSISVQTFSPCFLMIKSGLFFCNFSVCAYPLIP